MPVEDVGVDRRRADVAAAQQFLDVTPDPGKLLEEALKLSPEARAALAASLLESLDEEVDEGAEAAWAEEIAKRIHELDSGAVTPIPWSEARRRILER